MTDLQAFEEALLSSRDDFVEKHNRSVQRAQEQFGKRRVSAKEINLPQQNPKKAPQETKDKTYTGIAYKTGHIVKLVVRKKRMSLLDEVFEYQSSKISETWKHASMQKKAAKAAGYPDHLWLCSMYWESCDAFQTCKRQTHAKVHNTMNDKQKAELDDAIDQLGAPGHGGWRSRSAISKHQGSGRHA
ncbi:MAG: hypothetical protein U5L98_15960 [Halomonas sp.]|uniref:hypothetical protein n=1 Tax=Halomonas sp. TaxID=1486246 RepID=UPI002ACDBDA9|nr:hypothetical protein [Halomonas sp.]MDZ7854085.1 hypothetical protein [Halomonas sp.]